MGKGQSALCVRVIVLRMEAPTTMNTSTFGFTNSGIKKKNNS